MAQSTWMGKCSKCGRCSHLKRNKDGVQLCSDCRNPHGRGKPEAKAIL